MERDNRKECAWIIRELRPFASLQVVSFFCISLASTLGLANPLIMKWLIDRILPNKNWRLLPVASGCFFAAYAGQMALSWAANLATFQSTQRMMLNIRIKLLEHLQRLTASYHEKALVGDVLFRLEQDVDQVGELGGDLAPNLLRLVLSTVLVIGAMIWLNWRLTCVVLPLMPIFVVLHHHYQKALQVRAEAVQEHSGKRSALLQEQLPALLQIQLLGRERAQLKKFADAAVTAVRSCVEREYSAMQFSMATMTVVIFGMTVILAWGGGEVVRGTFTIGGLVAFYGYLAGLFGPLGSAVDLYSRTQRVGASIRRILEIQNLKPGVADRPDARRLAQRAHGEISFHGVSYAYSAGTTALAGINIQVNSGDRVAIVGPSGGGKSTIAKLAARYYEPDQGYILLDGFDVREIEVRSLRSAISFVPQEPMLFYGSLRENLLMGNPHARSAELEEAARISQLTSVIRSHKGGWEQQLGYSGKNLSGGEKQRVALARALLQDRPILILDEATSALDAPTEAAFLRALKESFPATTVLIISHRDAVSRWADYTIVLNEGRIVEQGTHSDLNREGKFYYKLWQRDAEVELVKRYVTAESKTA